MGDIGRHGRKDNLKELVFGDYSEGRWGWVLESPRTIKPVECKGALQLWNVPEEIKRQIL